MENINFDFSCEILAGQPQYTASQDNNIRGWAGIFSPVYSELNNPSMSGKMLEHSADTPIMMAGRGFVPRILGNTVINGFWSGVGCESLSDTVQQYCSTETSLLV